ncbi:MAG: hypothetical protein SGILL_007780, partial [Bacillariaceae sp.]
MASSSTNKNMDKKTAAGRQRKDGAETARSIQELLEFSKRGLMNVSSGEVSDLAVPSISILLDDGEFVIHGREVLKLDKRLSHQLLPSDKCFELDHVGLMAQPAFQRMLERIRADLGIQGKIEAAPYKFLFYETGCFFEKHRDHERLTNQVGTLILQLPSLYTGGDLTVFDNSSGKMASTTTSSQRMSYAAFFTDCFHEVTKLTSGNRCVLVFSLLSQPLPTQELSSLTSLTASETMKMYLKEYKAKVLAGKSSDKMIIPLSHAYSHFGLGYATIKPHLLKGPDVEVVAIVAAAMNDADFEGVFYLLNSDGPSVPDKRSKKKNAIKVICDSESPPIQLSEKLQVDGFYLADEMRMPIYKKDTVVGLSQDMLTGKDHHGEKSYTYRTSAIVIWPKSRRHK